jgi:hypothetical protein
MVNFYEAAANTLNPPTPGKLSIPALKKDEAGLGGVAPEADPLETKLAKLKTTAESLKTSSSQVPVSEIQKAVGDEQWHRFSDAQREQLLQHLSKLLLNESISVSLQDLLSSMSVIGVSVGREWYGWLPYCTSNHELRTRVAAQLSAAQSTHSKKMEQDRQKLVVDLLQHICEIGNQRQLDIDKVSTLTT